MLYIYAIRKGLFSILLIGLFCKITSGQDTATSFNFKGGVNAVVIGKWHKAHLSVTDLLTKEDNILCLNNFYRVGGENIPATETKCYLTYTDDTLYVLYENYEQNLQYPRVQHKEDWYKMRREFRRSTYPDKIDFYFYPDIENTGHYLFSVTKEGNSFGEYQSYIQNEKEKISNFKSSVFERNDRWFVILRIPWITVKGLPKGYFGILPRRTRWREGETSSPAAIDFDFNFRGYSYIESSLGMYPQLSISGSLLTKRPSGHLHWNRSVELKYPSQQVIKKIFLLQKNINIPTKRENLEDRIILLQAWIDMLTLEGFNFRKEKGSIIKKDMNPDLLRQKMNKAFVKGDVENACLILDNYLKRLAAVSQRWYADGSPGNMNQSSWKSIDKVEDVKIDSNKIIIRTVVDKHRLSLNVSFPTSGGVRIWANKRGFFNPDCVLKINSKKIGDKYLFEAKGQKVSIKTAPFSMIVLNDDNNNVFTINHKNLSFFYDVKDSMEAFDFHQKLRKDEVIYGFGERYDHFDQRGQVLTLWGMDDWFGLINGLQHQTYKPIPVYYSSAGYSVFVNSSYRLRADIGVRREDEYRITQSGPVFDFYIWSQEPVQAVQSYTSLTGKPLLPPKWAFEPWIGRTGREWKKDGTRNPEEEQIRVIEKFDSLDIPHSAIYAEGEGSEKPDLYTYLNPKEMKVLSWFNSSIAEWEQKKLMPELQGSQLPILRFEKEINTSYHDIDYVDFTDPEAKGLSRRKWKRRLDLGVAGSMVDFGDRVPEDAIFYNGKKGDEMHNFYAYSYQKTYSEIFKERRGNDYFLFGRAAAPGTQKWVGQFAGDHQSSFKGLRGVLRGVLNLSSAGFSTWGSDLGGFGGWPDPVVYMRWTQFSCFSPLMRSHGRKNREPWEYGEVPVANYKYYVWVHENLLDYIYNEAIYAHKTGVPIVKSMNFAYPKSKGLSRIDDQYMFGRDLLVAPVVTEENKRDIILPPGIWIDFWTGEDVKGPGKITQNTTYRDIPVFMREGAIIPIKLDSALEFGESMSFNQVTALMVAPQNKGAHEKDIEIDGKKGSVILNKSKGVIQINLKEFLDLEYLIIYGETISKVTIKGHVIPFFSNGSDFIKWQPGWYFDKEKHRTIIRLPFDRCQSLKIFTKD